MKSTYYLLVLSFILFSCTNKSLSEYDSFNEKESYQDLLLEKGTSPITADQAVNVVKILEKRKEIKTKAYSSREIRSAQTIMGKSNSPVMYAVSFKDNQGFVIVSASRKYHPILADEDRNTIDATRLDSGVNLWIQEQSELIDCVESMSDSDASIQQYLVEWEDYERQSLPSNATKTDDLATLRANAIAAWEAQGYTCYDLCDCPNSLPQSVYEDWLDLAEQTANPNYDYYTNSIILYMREDTVSQHGPYLQTTWGQDNPYNANLALVAGLHPRAGCSVVAIGQIMRYYEWPTVYDWSSMNDHYAYNSNAPEVAAFFYDLGRDSHTHYYSDKSTTSLDTLMTALVSNQYAYHYYANAIDHNYSTVLSELVYERPVYMQGVEASSGNAHSWACDGFKTQTTYRNYILKVLSSDEPLAYVTAGSPYNSSTSSTYLHMNWGEDGEANGWFYQDLVNYSGPFHMITVSFNYSTQRKDIVGLMPRYNN